MDLEERERFFAAGAAAGGYDGPPGGPPGGMGPGPPGGRMPPPHRSEHTPQSQNDWGPPNEPRVSTREVLARQRQAEYNEQKELQERRREAALEQKRGRGGVHDGGFGGYGDPANARQRGGGLDMAFDENNEQRPRPKGFRGLRDIHSDADAARRVAADEKKRAYAADLQRQIDEAKLRKQLAKQRSLEVDRHNLGMHNIIPDMRGDGLLDGVDGVNGENLGYTYADAHPPDAPRPYHPAAGETPQQHADEQHESNQYHEHQYRHQTHQTHNAHQRFAPAPRGSYAVGPPGGHFADGVADGAKAEKLRKKQAYQRDLEMQIAEKARRKAAEKLAQQEMDSRDARAAMTNNPWGKGGGGAPVARHSAAGPSHQHGYEPYAYGQSGHDRPTGYVPEPSADSHHGGAPGGGVETDAYPTQIVPGGRAGVPGMGRFAASASNPNPTPSHVPGPRVSLFARGHEEMHPAELEAKNRARDELQHALRLQIEEKRLRKEEEKARREAEEAADQRRLAIEQERLREAFEREQAEERFKAEERMRLEEEAYQAAADKRREQKLVDMPMPEPREPKAVVSGRDDDALSADANRGAPRFASALRASSSRPETTAFGSRGSGMGMSTSFCSLLLSAAAWYASSSSRMRSSALKRSSACSRSNASRSRSCSMAKRRWSAASSASRRAFSSSLRRRFSSICSRSACCSSSRARFFASSSAGCISSCPRANKETRGPGTCDGVGFGFDALAAKRPIPGTPARPPGTICVGYASVSTPPPGAPP